MSTERTPMCFSNHGTRVDVHAWGQNVATSGYGDLHPETGIGPANRNWWYTREFGGTSSASPIVTGAAAIIQGIRTAASQPRLTPAELRALLTATGTVQTGQLDRLIGPFPNVREALRQSDSGPSNLDWLPAVLMLLMQ
jgi:subtilisin family serine protease